MNRPYKSLMAHYPITHSTLLHPSRATTPSLLFPSMFDRYEALALMSAAAGSLDPRESSRLYRTALGVLSACTSRNPANLHNQVAYADCAVKVGVCVCAPCI